MSAGSSSVKRMRGVRNENSLLFSVRDLAASQPASAAANENGHGHAGSGLLDLEGLTQSYFEARNGHAVPGPGAALPDAAVVTAWQPGHAARPGIVGIACAALTGVASAALILMATWMWIVPHAAGTRAPTAHAAAPASAPRTPEPPELQHPAALVTPADSLDASAETADPAPIAPAPAVSTEPVLAAASATNGTQRPARPAATSRPRPRVEAEQSATSNPAAAAECLDEVACLLASNPPACCTRPQSSQTGQSQASSPREEDTALPDKLDRAAIQAGIAQVRERVAACDRHGGTGTVSLSVRVDGDGRVSTVDVKSAPSQALGSCVAQAVEDARFARSRSGQRFVYPFVF